MKVTWKHVNAVCYRDKVSRKAKKRILGRKLNKNKLRKLLSKVEVVGEITTMYERPDIKPYSFCPTCGCTSYNGTGNLTEYPEHWEYFKCIRCGFLVGYIDNSRFVHALECKENNYNCSF